MPAPTAPAANGSAALDTAITGWARDYDVTDEPASYQVPDPKPTKPAAAQTANLPAEPAPSNASAPAPVAAAATPAAPAQVPPAAPPVVPPATPQPAGTVHPAWVKTRAEALGVHPLLLERLSTEDLTQYIFDEQARAIQTARQNAQSSVAADRAAPPSAGQVPGQPPVAVAATAPVEQGPPAFAWGEFEIDRADGTKAKHTYTEGDIDPAVAHHIKSQAARIEKLESFIGTMTAQVQRRADDQKTREFDAAFAKYPQVFGTGDAHSVPRGSQEFERRAATYQRVKVMLEAMPEAARAGMTIETAVDVMAQAMFGVKPAAAAAPPAQPPGGHPGQKFAQGTVAVPTQRRESDRPFGVERARQEVGEWWKEQRASGQADGDDTDLDQFLS